MTRQPLRRICVYCGSRSGARQAYVDLARALGRELAAAGLGLVYGGASVGLMGTLADAALAAGGEVIGVMPRALSVREITHPGLSELYVVDSMHARKAQMEALADGFIALPGGWGTLDELFEILTWAQLGLHGKPCGLLDAADYYSHLVAFIDHAVAEGFVPERHRKLIAIDSSPQKLIEALGRYRAPATKRWVGRPQV